MDVKTLYKTADMVKHCLENYPDARNSDDKLYYYVCRLVAEKKGIDLNRISVASFLVNSRKNGFPAFETVRRTRQKAQECDCSLRADVDVQAQRELNMDVFKDFSRGMY